MSCILAIQTDSVMKVAISVISTACMLGFSGCRKPQATREVIIYTSVDQVFSEPLLKSFEAGTGIRVKAVYDVEAAKTTGLATRLASEKERPRADVFWNNEFLQTLRLKEQGLLEDEARLGARARVLLVNTNLVKPADYPKSLDDLLNEKYPARRVGLALPLFGTTATHVAAIYAERGPEAARAFFEKLKARGVRVADGNGTVRDLVVSGELWFGLTDTDDALGAIERDAPVAVVVPDQDGAGTMTVFGTVAMVKGAPHQTEARQLIAWLLREETEQALIKSGCFQWSLRGGGAAVTPMFPQGLKTREFKPEEVLRALPEAMDEMKEIFVR